jgi:uncharacterized alpha-E superfamily protein
MKEAAQMLSRVADNLYWMSRYLERAEHTARVMGVQWNLMLEYEPGSAERRWTRVTASLGRLEPLQGEAFDFAQTFALTQIVGAITAARENARQVREQISSEMWEELNRLFHESKRIGTPELFSTQGFELVYAVIRSSNLFQGITDSTMSHGEGWQFIQAGRFMERIEAAAKLIDLHFAEYFNAAEPIGAPEHTEWLGLLRSCTAFEAYCKVYTADLRAERAAEFLLLNADFPHSIRFGAERLQHSLETIHQSAGGRKADRVSKLAGRLTAALSYTPLEEIMTNLHEFTTNIRRLCGQIHAGIYQVYISYPLDAALEG